MLILKSSFTLVRYVRWTLLSVLCGILAGSAAAAFLLLLDWATKTRDFHPSLVWGLPIAGFIIGWVYHQFGKEASPGTNLILDEIHDPQKIVPMRMAPLILVGTIVTHLFGGSAGREGTAVQMGASLADQLTRIFRIDPDERRILLVAGAGAGFGAAIGAPWAGVIFGMEVINIGRLRLFAWFECLISSFTGFYTAVLLGAPHSSFPLPEVPPISWKCLAYVFLAGVVFGLAAKFFSDATHFVERGLAKFIKYPPLKPLIGGFILLLLFFAEDSYRYAGLGIPFIQEAFLYPAGMRYPLLKAIFTAITIGSGFKGGEFIPLVFIGTTLGSALGLLIPVSFSLLAALGFAAVFAGAANTPIACTLMAMEIFGVGIAPYAFIACFSSYYVSGHRGIYKAQRIDEMKHKKFKVVLYWFGDLPKRFFNGGVGG